MWRVIVLEVGWSLRRVLIMDYYLIYKGGDGLRWKLMQREEELSDREIYVLTMLFEVLYVVWFGYFDNFN